MIDARRAVVLFALAALPASASGPEDSSPPPPAPEVPAPPRSRAVPDVAWAATKDRAVTVETTTGNVSGTVLGFDDVAVVLTLPTGVVTTVPRADIKVLRMAAVTIGAPVPEAEAEPEPGEPRHFGLHLGLSPGITGDVEYGLFYMFVSGSPVATLASSGNIFGFCAGAGLSITLPSHWHFDVFADVAPLWWTNGSGGFGQQNTYVGIGAGIGFHYTSPRGWAIGFKAPLIGAAAMVAGTTFNYDVATATAMFYLANVVSLPIVSLGYRF